MWIDLTLRWLHILSAIALLGGTFFIRWTLLPALSEISEEQRHGLSQAIRQRWSRVVGVASGFLLVSGLINAVNLIRTFQFQGPWGGAYHALVGLKLLIAMVVFVLAALLSGRTAAAEKIRRNQLFWLNVAVTLGVVLVVLGGVMKFIDRIPK